MRVCVWRGGTHAHAHTRVCVCVCACIFFMGKNCPWIHWFYVSGSQHYILHLQHSYSKKAHQNSKWHRNYILYRILTFCIAPHYNPEIFNGMEVEVLWTTSSRARLLLPGMHTLWTNLPLLVPISVLLIQNMVNCLWLFWFLCPMFQGERNL